MDYIIENCPLCNKAAKYYFVDHKNRKYFRCEYCKDFQLYIYAEKLLSETTKERKEEMSKASHDSVYEQVLFITSSSNTSGTALLHAEFHDRTTLPLK